MRAFRERVEAKDPEGLIGLLAEDVRFRSPVVFKPYVGKDSVGAVLLAVSQVFEDFRYTREYGTPGAADSALVFEARIGDRQVEGCDFIHTDASGKVDELLVMVRPLSGVHALAEAMKAMLERAQAASAQPPRA